MMVEQNITQTDLTTSGNGRKRGGSIQWHQTIDAKTKIGEVVKRKAREKREKEESRKSMDAGDEWAESLRLRGARPKTIAKLLSPSQDEGDTKNKFLQEDY